MMLSSTVSYFTPSSPLPEPTESSSSSSSSSNCDNLPELPEALHSETVVTQGNSTLTDKQRTLLNENVAGTISKVSTATRFSLRCFAFVMEAFFEAAMFSTTTSLAIGRQALISALSSARTNHSYVTVDGEPGRRSQSDEVSFRSIFNKYASLGIYLVHHTFSLAELFTMTTFHLTSSTIKFSLNAGEETVRVLDGLFGSTETSRALAAIVDIVRREMMASDGHASPHDLGPFGAFSSASKIVMLGAVTKAVTAFACLQKLTRRRKLAMLPVTTIFEFTVDYDRIRTADDLDSSNLHSTDHDDDLTSPIWVTESSCSTNNELSLSNAEIDELLESLADGAFNKDDDEGVVQTSRDEIDVHTITTISEINREEESDYILLQHQPPSFQSLVSGFKKHVSSPQIDPKPPCSSRTDLVGSKKSRTSIGKPNSLELLPSPTSTRHKQKRTQPIKPLAQPTHIYPKQPLINNLSRYLQYSTGAYGKQFMRLFGIGQTPILSVVGDVHHPYHHAFANHVGIPVTDIILSTFQKPRSGYLSQTERMDAKHRNFFNTSTVLSLEAPKIHPLVHYLCIDHDNKSIVLTLRGTLGLSDVLTDLTCDYADLSVYNILAELRTLKASNRSEVELAIGHIPNVKKVYQAHAGMVKNAELLANQLGPYIKHVLADHAEYGLILCGHSLGGGVAAILAVLWSDWFNDAQHPPITDNTVCEVLHCTAKSSGLPSGRPLHCYTYGCPCIVSEELSLLSESLITSVVHGSDVISSLSLGMLQDFKSMSRTMNDSRNRGVAEKIITRALGITKSPRVSQNQEQDVLGDDCARAWRVEDDWLWSLMQTIRAEMVAEKLYPAGTIYWLRTKAYVRRTTHTATTPPSSSTGGEDTGMVRGLLSTLTGRYSDSVASSSSTVEEEHRCYVELNRLNDAADLLGELRFSKSMFTDHNPRFYHDGIYALLTGVNGYTVT